MRFLLPTIGLLLIPNDPGDEAKRELTRLQGRWACIASERKGEAIPEDTVREARIRIVIAGETVTAINILKGCTATGRISVDPTREPKAVDIMLTEGDEEFRRVLEQLGVKEVALPGIYTLDGDEWRMCSTLGAKEERPMKFETKVDSFTAITVMRREQP